MEILKETMAQQVAQAASAFQAQRTGHVPKAVTVVLSESTLVITLHGALSPSRVALDLVGGASLVGFGFAAVFRAPGRTLAVDLEKNAIRRFASAGDTVPVNPFGVATDAEGNVGDALHLLNGASKGKKGGRTVPLNATLRDALIALKAR